MYPPVIGGTEGHVGSLAQALAGRGHSVSVATARVPGTPAFEVADGIRVHRVRSLAERAGPHENAARPYQPPFPDPLVTRALWRIVKRERPDVVHAHSPIVHSFIPLKRLSRARLVLTMHDYAAICAVRMLMRNGSPCSGPGAAQVHGVRHADVRRSQGPRPRDGAPRGTAGAGRRRSRDRGERRRRACLRGAATPDRGRAELPAPWRRRCGAAGVAPGVAPGRPVHPLCRRARREQGRGRPPARAMRDSPRRRPSCSSAARIRACRTPRARA